jgi:pimeloyl-ACP methyl ester carboxylesterase
MSETTIIIDGIRSPLLQFGPASSDEAVVFVHGNPGSIRDWGALARSVGEFGRAVAIDMPGFGAADKPANFDHSVGGYARHLSKLMADRPFGIARFRWTVGARLGIKQPAGSRQCHLHQHRRIIKVPVALFGADLANASTR